MDIGCCLFFWKSSAWCTVVNRCTEEIHGCGTWMRLFVSMYNEYIVEYIFLDTSTIDYYLVDIFINTLCASSFLVFLGSGALSEWLRSLPAKQVCYACEGSNPSGVAVILNFA